MKSLFHSLDSILSLITKPIIVVIGIFIALGFVVGIVSRSIIGESIFGLEELILLSVIWFYMLGASLASQERSHLQGDFLPLLIKNAKVVKLFQLLTTVISIAMACLFFSWSYDLLMWGINKKQSTPVFAIPWYTSQASLLVCATLMVVYLLRDLVRDVLSLWSE